MCGHNWCNLQSALPRRAPQVLSISAGRGGVGRGGVGRGEHPWLKYTNAQSLWHCHQSPSVSSNNLNFYPTIWFHSLCSARQCSVTKRPVVQIVVQLWCSFLNQSVSSFNKENEVSKIKKLSDNNKRSCICNRISQSWKRTKLSSRYKENNQKRRHFLYTTTTLVKICFKVNPKIWMIDNKTTRKINTFTKQT